MPTWDITNRVPESRGLSVTLAIVSQFYFRRGLGGSLAFFLEFLGKITKQYENHLTGKKKESHGDSGGTELTEEEYE